MAALETGQQTEELQRLEKHIHDLSLSSVAELERIRRESRELLKPTNLDLHDPLTALAVKLYTGGGPDRTINGHLRNPAWGSLDMQAAIPWWGLDVASVRAWFGDPAWLPTAAFVLRRLRRLLQLAPRTQREVVLYRGVRSDEFLLQEENAFRELGLMSLTGNLAAADRYAGQQCCLLYMVIPEGTPILHLGSVSPYPGEDEFLLQPGRNFRVQPQPAQLPVPPSSLGRRTYSLEMQRLITATQDLPEEETEATDPSWTMETASDAEEEEEDEEEEERKLTEAEEAEAAAEALWLREARKQQQQAPALTYARRRRPSRIASIHTPLWER